MKNKPHLIKCLFVLKLMILNSTYDIHKVNGLEKIVKCNSKTDNFTADMNFCNENTICLIQNIHLINITILFFLLGFY